MNARCLGNLLGNQDEVVDPVGRFLRVERGRWGMRENHCNLSLGRRELVALAGNNRWMEGRIVGGDRLNCLASTPSLSSLFDACNSAIGGFGDSIDDIFRCTCSEMCHRCRRKEHTKVLMLQRITNFMVSFYRKLQVEY